MQYTYLKHIWYLQRLSSIMKWIVTLTMPGTWFIFTWDILGIYLEHAWNVPETFLVFTWHIIYIYLVHHWYLPGTPLVLTWYTLGTYLGHPWYFHVTSLVLNWGILGCYLGVYCSCKWLQFLKCNCFWIICECRIWNQNYKKAATKQI